MHTEYTADRIKKNLYKISLILSVSALICVCQPGGKCSKVYAADEETSNEEISDEMSDDDTYVTNIGVSYDPDSELEKRIEDSMSEESFRSEIKISDAEMEAAIESASNQVYESKAYKTSYDDGNRMYHYYWSDVDGVYMSIPNGGMTPEAVSVVTDEASRLVALSKDGESILDEISDASQFVLREPGHYNFMVKVNEDGADYRFIGAFRILETGRPIKCDYIATPDGYSIESVIYENAEIRVDDKRYLVTDRDGAYQIVYRPVYATGGLPMMSVSFVRDTMPPMIEFKGDIKNGYFVSNVSYTVSDPSAELEIFYNGMPAYSSANVLAAAGSYFIRVTDDSGNMRVYSLAVARHGYIPWTAVALFLLIFILVGMIIILTSHKSMRIK